MKTRPEFSRVLMLLPLLVGFSSQAFALPDRNVEQDVQPSGQNVVVFERPNFAGRSRSFGIGRHRLFSKEDFNDLTASIRVPAGLVAVVYEHADEGGGYGTWVDLLEDQADLSKYNFHGKISYLDIFYSRRKSVPRGDSRPAGFVWARNSMQNGQFVPGHWEGVRARGNPVNPNPVVAPAKPPNTPTTPPVSTVCTISGSITRDKPEYATRVNLLRDDGSRTVVLWVPVNSGRYGFANVPVGKYVVVPKGNYPTGEGRMGGLAPFPWSENVSCEPNGNYTVNFKISSTEG